MKACENIIGIDEVGYGAWAGPVFACAVFFDKEIDKVLFNEIKDSKKINKRKLSILYNQLTTQILYGIGFATPEEIDKINIKNATYKAMERAFQNLPMPDYLKNSLNIIIDGNSNPNFSNKISTLIDGDDKIKQISCASIIAKVTRDNVMKKLHDEFPQYNWKNNVGYGTRQHIEAIKNFGVTRQHRLSYKPIKIALNQHNI